MRTPEEIVKELAPAYKRWKGGEKDKEKFRKEFFGAVTEHLKEHGDPAEDFVLVEGETEQEAREQIERDHPGWLIDAIRHGYEPETWEAIIVEDPEYMPFSIEVDGQVWTRQISSGATMLDDERLRTERPKLWKEVTAYPWEELLMELASDEIHSEEETAQTVTEVCERYGLKRELLPLEELPPEIAAELQHYVYEGKPSVKLPAPKEVKG